MKKFIVLLNLPSLIIIFLTSFSIAKTCFTQEGWELIHSFSETVNSICFINTTIGFASTNTAILKSTDGGLNWENALTTASAIQKIYFFDHIQGYAIGYNGVLYKTINSGIDWVLIPTIETGIFRSIFFLDQFNGWICMNDKVLKTTDGGNNWNGSLTVGAIANCDVEFVDQLNGYAVGLYAKMFKSTDGGISWTSTIEPMVASMFGIQFINEDVGFICGGPGIVRTSNGGETWSTVYSSGGAQLNSIESFGNNFLWSAGSGKIVFSSNGGLSWTPQSYSPYSYLTLVECVDSVNVWILGDRKLYRTSNGGITGMEIEHHVEENYYLSQNYPNPFNPTTKINYQIPEFSFVTIKVFDLLGREVATLVNEEQPTGSYTVEFNGSMTSSGVYFFKLWAENYYSLKKMILIK